MSAPAARAGAAALAFALGACSDYLDRRDTLLLGAGDAVRTNIVTQVIDPWPEAALDTRPDFNGERLQKAVERYRNPQVGGGTGGGAGPAIAIAPAAPLGGGPGGLR